MVSLHLPAPKRRQFSRREIAEISRGADVVRERRKTAAGLPWIAELFEARLTAYQEARSAVASARKAMGNMTEAAWIDVQVGRPLYPMHCRVAAATQVSRDERRAKANLRQEIDHNSSVIADRDHPLFHERMARLSSAKRDLKTVPAAARRVRAAVRAHLVELRRLHKRHDYRGKLVKESRTLAGLWDAFKTAQGLPIESNSDAAAAIRLATAVIQSKAIYSDGALELLQRAQAYLAANKN